MNAEDSHVKGFGQRLAVVGTTGSGKTTLARQIAQSKDVPHIELDALHWEPNWTETPLAVFRARVTEAVTPAAWTTDGNYSKVRDIVWNRADTIIWLDYSLGIILTQLLKRTLRRVVTHEELWSGNHEDWRNAFFSRNSLFLWAIKTHGRHRREYPLLLAQPDYAHLQLIRLDSPQATATWLAQLTSSIQEKVIPIDDRNSVLHIHEM